MRNCEVYKFKFELCEWNLLKRELNAVDIKDKYIPIYRPTEIP